MKNFSLENVTNSLSKTTQQHARIVRPLLIGFAIFSGLVVMIAGSWGLYHWKFQALQRFYFRQYLIASTSSFLIPEKPAYFNTLFEVSGPIISEEPTIQNKGRLLSPDDVKQILVFPDGRFEVVNSLSFTGEVLRMNIQDTMRGRRDFLASNIFQGSSLFELFKFPFYLGLLNTLGFGILAFFIQEKKSKDGAKEWIDGVKPVTVPGFINIIKGDGIAVEVYDDWREANFVVRGFNEVKKAIEHLVTTECFSKKQLQNFMSNNLKDIRWRLRIEAFFECLHMTLFGDTGTGKSQFMLQLLALLNKMNVAAVLYDPDGLFAKLFFNEQRGDIIINPYDRRCPLWTLKNEIGLGDAKSVASSIIVREGKDNGWFYDKAIDLTTMILKEKLDNETLIEIFSNIDRLREFAKGTEFETVLSQSAPEQAAGVVSTMTNVATFLKFFDPKAKAWDTKSWGEKRKGWVFITPRQFQQEQLHKLNTAIIDMLITRILSMPEEEAKDKPVWLFLDELASLKKLPMLMKALTESRKYNCRCVLGFQGTKQLKSFYGDDILTTVTQSETVVGFKTREPGDLEYKAKWFGTMKVQNTKITETKGKNNERSETVAHSLNEEPVVPGYLFNTLEPREAFLRYKQLVTRIKIPVTNLPPVTDAFIPREDLEEELNIQQKEHKSQNTLEQGTRQPRPTTVTSSQPSKPKQEAPDSTESGENQQQGNRLNNVGSSIVPFHKTPGNVVGPAQKPLNDSYPERREEQVMNVSPHSGIDTTTKRTRESVVQKMQQVMTDNFGVQWHEDPRKQMKDTQPEKSLEEERAEFLNGTKQSIITVVENLATPGDDSNPSGDIPSSDIAIIQPKKGKSKFKPKGQSVKAKRQS